MKFLSVLFLFPILSFSANKSVILTYKYTKNSKSAVKSITLKELKWVYNLTKQQTPYYPPSPKQFFTDYLRFKLGVEVALYDKKMITNPNIEKSIVNPFLKSSFQQELYKAFAEQKLQPQMKALQKRTMRLSDGQLRNLYKKDSQYNFFYISIKHPIKPTAQQKKEATARSKKVYNQVKTSKKPFTDLVALTSDDKFSGLLNWNRTRASITPQVYAVIKRMKDGAISRPIKVADGYIIVKLNKKIPFKKNVHEKPLKDNYFAAKKTVAFNKYMDGLKRNFKIKFINKKLINSLK